MNDRLAGIYVILDAGTMPDLQVTQRFALQAGIRLFQYRDKRGCDAELLRALYHEAHAMDALLLVNDHVDLTPLADGIHVGQDDLAGTSIAALRARFPDKIIGVSANTPAHAKAAIGADYLGVGPFHATATKQIDRAALGIAGLHEMVNATSLPVCAIGGISVDDLMALRAAGCTMAATIGYLAHATDQLAAAHHLVEHWNRK